MLSSTPAGRPPAIALQPPPSGPAGASGGRRRQLDRGLCPRRRGSGQELA